jgi:hypothetical protein
MKHVSDKTTPAAHLQLRSELAEAGLPVFEIAWEHMSIFHKNKKGSEIVSVLHFGCGHIVSFSRGPAWWNISSSKLNRSESIEFNNKGR